jgi:hypothetical protein
MVDRTAEADGHENGECRLCGAENDEMECSVGVLLEAGVDGAEAHDAGGELRHCRRVG